MIKHLVCSLLPLFGVLVALPASAAVLSIVPDRYVVKVGDTFSADVLINSEDTGINAAQATLQYPMTLVEVVKIDTSASTFNYWLDGPTFSNAAGTVTFTGGSSNGVSGKSLQAVRIVFKVKGSGNIQLVFAEGAVAASDGSGTNVLNSMKGVSIDAGLTTSVATGTKPLAPLPVPKQIIRAPVKVAKISVQPIVEVPLYPDSKLWYNVREDFLVVWTLPVDVSDVATAMNQDPTFTPTKSEGLFDSKMFRASKDGVWYVHVRFKNNIGWGETSHYKISIDTVPPLAFSINVLQGDLTDNPSPFLSFASGDTISGINYYEVQDDDDAPVRTVTSTYTFPPLEPGTHAIRVRATDLAGNTSESSLSLTIKPIESPVITSWNKTSYVGEGGLSMHGVSASGTHVELVLRGAAGEVLDTVTATPDGSGAWRAIFDQPLKAGMYSIEARSRDDRGARSLSVITNNIQVGTRPALIILGFPITATALLIAIGMLLLGAFGMGQYLAKRQQTLQMWHSVLARRDVTAFLERLNQDLEKSLRKLEETPMNKRSLMEIKRTLLDLKERVATMGKYLIEAIEDITKSKSKMR